MPDQPIITKQTIIQSILDLRKIYSDLSPERFAQMYARKYKIKASAVLKVIQQYEGDENAKNKEA